MKIRIGKKLMNFVTWGVKLSGGKIKTHIRSQLAQARKMFIHDRDYYFLP